MKPISRSAFLTCFLSMSLFTAQAQDSTRFFHLVGGQFGVNQVKDENLHPKVSTGTITELSYGFENITRSNSLQQFNLNMGYSRLKTELEDLSKSVNLKLNLNYSSNYRLLHKKNFNYYLGPGITLAYSGSYFPNWDESHLYWANHLSLGVKNIFSFTIKNKNEWVSSISIPLYSAYSRPQLYRLYKMDDITFGGFVKSYHDNISTSHFINVFFLKVQSEYRFPVFSKKKEAVTYTFDFLRMKGKDARPFTQLSHQIGIKFFL